MKTNIQRVFRRMIKVAILLLTILLTSLPAQDTSAAVKKKVSSVTLDYNTYVLQKGKSVKLTATCLPKTASNRKVTWKSSKKSVATVNASGKVTAKKTGTATITATAKDGSKKKAACKIKVVKSIKKITSMKLTASKKTITEGKSVTVKATIKPSKATLKTLYWTSSNTSVATVSQKGVVKGKKAGKVKITAKAQDGSKKKATCTITVKAKNKTSSNTNTANNTTEENQIVKVSNIILSANQLNVSLNAAQVLTASVTPSNATNKKLIWTSSDSNIASVDANGKVTAKSYGKATITAVAADGGGKLASCSVHVCGEEDGSVHDDYNRVDTFCLKNKADSYGLQYQNGIDKISNTLQASNVLLAPVQISMAVGTDGITTTEEFAGLWSGIGKTQLFRIFGMQSITASKTADNAVTLQIQTASGTQALTLNNIRIVSNVPVIDNNGITTIRSTIYFEINQTGEGIYMSIHANGSEIAMQRSLTEPEQMRFYTDNRNQQYVWMARRVFISFIRDYYPAFYDFKNVTIYNVYQ